MKNNSKILFVALMSILALTGCGKGGNTTHSSTMVSSESEITSVSESSASSNIESSISSDVSSNVSSDVESSNVSSEESSSIEEEDIIEKELYPGLSTGDEFSKTTEEKVYDGFSFLPGTTKDTSSKTITLPDGLTTLDGQSTIKSGGRFKLEGSSSAIPTKKAIKFIVNGPGKIVFCAQSASTSDTSRTITICDENGTELYTSDHGASCSEGEWFEFEYESKGTYYIYSKVNGVNFYYFRTISKVAKGVENGFVVNSDNVRKTYLVGEDLDLSALQVYATFSNGNQIKLENSEYSINSSSYNKNVAGKYNIAITYKSYTPINVEVEVIVPSNFKLFLDGFADYKNNVQTTYPLNATVNLSNLVLKVFADDGLELIVPKNNYVIDTSSIDVTTAGTYNATITYSTFGTWNVPVTIAPSITSVDGVDTIAIDATKTNGTIVDSVLTFTTLQNGLDYLNTLNHLTAVNILLPNTTLNEKVTINTPNVTLIGQANSVISYNVASGSFDPKGVAYGTQNSYTFGVNATAENLLVKNVKIENAFDYKTAKISDKQAVAVFVQADKVMFEDCYFTSFQDTLYAKVGRQVYKNCVIEGAIDFIFGNNAPCYFVDSTIRSLNRDSATNGGYITAPKGVNSGSDKPTYGYVFSGCDFTAEEGVANGSVSLGRPWGQSATVAIINSTLGAHISKRAYGEAKQEDGRNYRYEIMDKNTPDKADFKEYGNTGEGAITEAVTGMTMLNAEEASLYTYQNILSKTNGNLSFTSDWELTL